MMAIIYFRVIHSTLCVIRERLAMLPLTILVLHFLSTELNILTSKTILYNFVFKLPITV